MPGSRERLKIGLVLDDGLDAPDGVQQYILALGHWLTRQGHEVRYLVGFTKRRDIPGLYSLSKNVSVRFNGNRMSIPLPAKRSAIQKVLSAEAFDVLHVQVPYSPFMAARLIKAAPQSTAVIGTFHIAPNGSVVTLGTKALGLWLRPSLRRFDDMVGVSQAAVSFAAETFGGASGIVPNMIEYPRFNSADPFKRYDDGVPTILFLGRLVPRKGCRLLLEAATKLMHDNIVPEFRIVICGKGPLEAELKEYVTQHDLTSIVEFAGFVEEADKPKYYASANVSVFPSSGGESFGIVLLEAMASGKAAVLAGDNPGYRSVMSPRSELLFDPLDPAGLAERIKMLLTDREKRMDAAAWGAAYAAEFDSEKVGTRLLERYDAALRKRRRQ
jgi:phosphatidylinositol alpha-mannosyltransferase